VALEHPVKATTAARDILVGHMARVAAVAAQVLLARMPLYHRLARAARGQLHQSLEHP
jgi:hypothetical protein